MRALCGHCTGALYRHRGPHVFDLSRQDPKYSLDASDCPHMRDRSGIVRAQCGHSAGTVRAPRERCTFGIKCGCLRWASNTRKSPLGLPGAHSLSEPPSSMLPPPAARSRAHRRLMSPTAARTEEGDVATAVRRRRFKNSSLDSFLLAGQEPSCSRMRWLTQRLMERILHVRDQRPTRRARLGLA